MKKMFKSLILVLSAIGMMFSCCEKCGENHSPEVECKEEVILYGGGLVHE